METKSNISAQINGRMTKGLLLALLVMAAGASNGWSETTAADKAKGEEMLRQAQMDLKEAYRLSQASVKETEAAHEEALKANEKWAAAHNLEREAFLLLRDSNRMKGLEIRSKLDREELQLRSEKTELARLQGMLAHQLQTVKDTTGAAAKMQNAAQNETNPAEKAELAKMAESLKKQGIDAGNEELAIEKRIAPLQAEVSRLQMSVTLLSGEAKRFAPPEK